MSQHWRPTARSYLGRVTKAHILVAVREACGEEAARRIADMKKAPMAEAAEQLLGDTGWLPPLLRTERRAVPALQEDRVPDADASDPAFSGDVDPFEAEEWDQGSDQVHLEADGVDDGTPFPEAAE